MDGHVIISNHQHLFQHISLMLCNPSAYDPISLVATCTVLALVIVPVISVAVRKFGRFLRELSHQTQAAAAVASSIAEVCIPEHLVACDSLMGM